MNKTSVYGLNLPEGTDLFDIENFNENTQKIENELIETSNSIDQINNQLSGVDDDIDEINQNLNGLKFLVVDGILTVTYDDGQEV